MARRLGASDTQLEGVARGRYDGFEPAWQAALRAADELTPTRGTVSDVVYDTLAQHWSAEQIVEIVAAICMFAFFNRFAHALKIPITK